jgi:hypothetical protein
MATADSAAGSVSVDPLARVVGAGFDEVAVTAVRDRENHERPDRDARTAGGAAIVAAAPGRVPIQFMAPTVRGSADLSTGSTPSRGSSPIARYNPSNH